jgi:hypothetical protein
MFLGREILLREITDTLIILTDYIYHQNEKSKPREMDLPFLKNDITKNFEALNSWELVIRLT